jgi:hypothetical protein
MLNSSAQFLILHTSFHQSSPECKINISPRPKNIAMHDHTLHYRTIYLVGCPTCLLRVEGEGCADLVGGLVELLGIKGGTETEGNTGAEEDVVCESSDTTIINLDL